MSTRPISTIDFALHDNAIVGAAPWLHTDDLNRGGKTFEDMSHTRRHGAAAESDEDSIHGNPVLSEFESDRPGPLTAIEVLVVLDKGCDP